MKRLIMLFLFIFCFVPLIGCKSDNQKKDPSEIIDPNNNNNNNQFEIKNGTEVAKILLANERLDEKVLKQSGTIFTAGTKAMSKIIDKTRQYLKRDAGRPNETYTEVDGDTIKWYNDVDYSNYMAFFESYAINIEHSAKKSVELIEYTKKNIRVVNKWVQQHNEEYLLIVNENSETIFNRRENYINICKRYTDENGNNVYEILEIIEATTIRMKYIPDLLYEFSIQFGKDSTSKMYLNADKSKGYWTIFNCGNIHSYQDENDKTFEVFSPIIAVLKDEANYQMDYRIDTNGQGEISEVRIISSDGKTDLISLGVDSMQLYNTGIKGLNHIEITAPKDKIGEFVPNSTTELYVYEEDNINDKGEKYKIYSTSGHKSATAVLENGMTLTENDVLLDGKVTVNCITVNYSAGCDSYGIIPLRTTATNYEEQFEILNQFLEETDLTFRRDFNDVINGLKYSLKDVKNFRDYFTWNGYHLNSIDLIKKAIQVEDEKQQELENLYIQVKDIEVINIEDQEKYNENIHFADIVITNTGTITNEEFKISIKDFKLKVDDTLLFVDKEMYKIVFALLNKEGNIISFLNEKDLSSSFAKGNSFELTQTKNIEVDNLEEGEYTLVAYIALANEGIRITNYIKVTAEIVEFTKNTQGYITTIKSNDNKELLLVSEKDHNLYYEIKQDFTHQMLLDFMGQAAYDHGMIDELIIEKFDGEKWMIVEKLIIEEPTIGDETIIPDENHEELEEEITYLEKGQYRMKYIVNNKQEAYVYVTIE